MLTNAAGAHAVSIAEYCVATMIMLARNFLQLFRDKQARHYEPRHSPVVELSGKRLGIVGYGHIGRELARVATAFNMRVLALKRDPGSRKAEGYQWPGVGDPDGRLPERFYGPEELEELLAESDFVVNCLPHTPQTSRMFGWKQFRAMKPSACFVNIGRGETIEEESLIRALREGVITAAGVDVFSTYPDNPGPDHPFWDVENLFISPHVSGDRSNPRYLDRTNELFCDNLRRYLAGSPLLNVATRRRGY